MTIIHLACILIAVSIALDVWNILLERKNQRLQRQLLREYDRTCALLKLIESADRNLEQRVQVLEAKAVHRNSSRN